MDEHELEQVLNLLGREQLEPPEALVRKTKRALHRTRAIALAAFLTLSLVVLTGVGLVLFFTSPRVSAEAKAYGLAGVVVLSGALLLVAGATRSQAAAFLRRIEAYTM
jgi:hypothetical protein